MFVFLHILSLFPSRDRFSFTKKQAPQNHFSCNTCLAFQSSELLFFCDSVSGFLNFCDSRFSHRDSAVSVVSEFYDNIFIRNIN